MYEKGFIKRTYIALKGYKKMKKSGHNSPNTLHFLFPDSDETFNRKAIRVCMDKVKEKERVDACFWFMQKRDINPCEHLTIFNVNEKTMRELMHYYLLGGFKNNMLLVSLEQPYGRFGSRLLRNMSVEDFVDCIVAEKLDKLA
jgi:hypothetical protein